MDKHSKSFTHFGLRQDLKKLRSPDSFSIVDQNKHVKKKTGEQKDGFFYCPPLCDLTLAFVYVESIESNPSLHGLTKATDTLSLDTAIGTTEVGR